MLFVSFFEVTESIGTRCDPSEQRRRFGGHGSVCVPVSMRSCRVFTVNFHGVGGV
ncbi:unnamed protein product [Ectocarpus sp. 12 AP-2014]